jgi:hypothetical protein
MQFPIADAIASAGLGYVGVGLVFGIWLALRGAGRLDPVARQGSPGFRLLTLPGATLLWPWLIARVLRQGGQSA